MRSGGASARMGQYAGVACFAAIWLLLAVFLFAPSLDRPIDLIDFHDITPLIRASDSAWDALVSVSALYQRHGRLSVVSYAYFIAKWYAFGDWGLGWQIVRLVEVAVTAALFYLLLRRLGAGRTGAALAQFLLLATPSSAKIWEWLNVAEAAGTLLVVVVAHLVLNGHANNRERLRLAAIFCSVLVLAFLKEMLLTALVLPVWWLGTLQHRNGSITARPHQRMPRDFLVVIAAAATASIPILYVAFTSPEGSYARHYLGGSMNAGSVLLSGVALLIPFQPPTSPHSILELGALIAYSSILLLGWRVLLVTRRGDMAGQRILLLAVTFVVSGVAAYAPWHDYRLMYAYPFQLGTGLLIAFAVTGLQSARILSRSLVSLAWLAILIVMISQAYGDARFYHASLKSVRDVAVVASTLPRDADVYVRSCGVPGGDWANLGDLAGRFARTIDLPAPSLLRDTSCASTPHRLPGRSSDVHVVTLRVAPLFYLESIPDRDRVSTVVDLSRVRLERYRWSVNTWRPTDDEYDVE